MENLQKQLEEAGYKGKHDLSSYIEACGEDFFGLHQLANVWGANSVARNLKVMHGKGKSPEIAVARLWLELTNN